MAILLVIDGFTGWPDEPRQGGNKTYSRRTARPAKPVVRRTPGHQVFASMVMPSARSPETAIGLRVDRIADRLNSQPPGCFLVNPRSGSPDQPQFQPLVGKKCWTCSMIQTARR